LVTTWAYLSPRVIETTYKTTFKTLFIPRPRILKQKVGPKPKGIIYNPSFPKNMREMNDKIMARLSANVYNLTPPYFVNYNSHNNKQKVLII